MAIKALNSVGGFSVGEIPVTIVSANGDVTTLNLSANANVLFTGSNVSLGQIANLHILGGSAGQVVQTDGAGNLVFATVDSSGLSNGNSNVRILANGNLLFSSAGNANVLVITGTGADITGTANVTGNITSGNANLGNVASANYLTGTLTTAAQPNITSVGLLTNLSVAGNIAVGSGNIVVGDFTRASNAIIRAVTSDGYIAGIEAYGEGQGAGYLYIGQSGAFGGGMSYNGDLSPPYANGETLDYISFYRTNNGARTVVFDYAYNSDQVNFKGGILVDDVIRGNANITANGNIIGANITSNGSISGANIYANSGTISASSLTGTLTTNAQPNVTSVGSLTSLNVVGNTTAYHILPAALDTYDLGSASVPWRYVYAATVEAVIVNATTGNFSGSLEVAGNITGGNINGNISGNISGNVTAAGANTQVLFNDSNVVNAVSGLTFDKVTNTLTTGNLIISTTGTIPNIVSANITTSSNANLNIEPNGTGVVVIANTAGGATAIALGDPTQGNLVSNAVTLSNSSSVSNAIAQLNLVLGKLVPPAPPNFPASQTIAIQSLSTFRMANYVQTDNTPGANKSVAGGTTVTSVRRANSYTTGNITVAGPGDTGTITAFLNGTDAGNRTLTSSLNGNGTYSNLVIFNNYDYNSANANIAAGFWSVFSSRVAGTVTEGWNEVYIADSAASNSNTANWFYDSSAPGTPTFSSLGITPPVSPSYVYSSTVPHYDNTNIFNVTFNVNKLSGNMYPTSDAFVTGSAGGSFGAPASVTYSTAGITTPLAQNLYVSSGNASVSTTSTIISGFGASTTGPSVSAFNSYNTGTQAFTTQLAANVLYKTGTTSSASRIEEANVFVGSTIGSGSGLAVRIVNPGSTNTPVFTGSEAAFNSQSSTLQTYDSTVVANVLKHDQTNYSTGYLPAGPNLSAGRSGTQYFTFKIARTSVSKFDIRWSGNIAGLWVALPGSTIDTTSSANGWLSVSTAYAGAGIPGVNAPGNGSDGCALGGVAPLNSVQTNKSVTATFGTVSSSSTATNEIYIRIALTSGQSVTALSLQTASN
jgi:hypothetical protein